MADHQMNRLERILELVTEHEKVYREQDIRLAEVAQAVTDLKVRSAADWAPLQQLKERNVVMELDLARAAVETVVRQLASVTKANQALQAELKTCQQKQAQQQLSYESSIAVLQADLAALCGRVDDMQSNTQSAVDQLRSSLRLQMEQQRAEADNQLQSAQQELDSKLSHAVHEATAKAYTTVRDLENWTKQEMLQLAAKLKVVVQSCSNHQQQVNLQMEALQQQWDNTSAALEGLQQEDKRCKKNIGRLQQQAEEFQRATQNSASAAAALQQLQADFQELVLAHQQLLAQHEAVSASSNSCSKGLQEATQYIQQLDVRLAAQAADFTGFADSVLGCLSAARTHAAAAAAAQPSSSSYLTSLLGPAVNAQVPVGAIKPTSWGAWDEQLTRVDDVVTKLRHHQRGSAPNCSTQQGLNSPSARRSFIPRGTYQSGLVSAALTVCP